MVVILIPRTVIVLIVLSNIDVAVAALSLSGNDVILQQFKIPAIARVSIIKESGQPRIKRG